MPALASPNRRLLCLPQHSFALAEYLGRTDAIQATLAATGDEDTSGAAAGQYRGQREWQATQGILCLRYPPRRCPASTSSAMRLRAWAATRSPKGKRPELTYPDRLGTPLRASGER